MRSSSPNGRHGAELARGKRNICSREIHCGGRLCGRAPIEVKDYQIAQDPPRAAAPSAMIIFIETGHASTGEARTMVGKPLRPSTFGSFGIARLGTSSGIGEMWIGLK